MDNVFWNYGMDNLKNVKKEYFLKNGAMLKRKQIEYWGERALPIRIFSAEELLRGTDGIIRNSRKCKGCIDGRSFYFLPRTVRFDHQAKWVIEAIAIQANIYHKNVERLLGCCLETRYPVPIYESISNDDRTLFGHLRRCDHHRYGQASAEQLCWSDRIRIAAEVADALNYLHTHSSLAIIHTDVGPSNILLDDRLTAKLTGFHRSLTMPADREEDYTDPSDLSTDVVNEKTDVYNLGAVIFVLLSGICCSCLIPYEPTTLEICASCLKKGRFAEIPFEGKTEQIQAFTICEGKTEQVEALCELTLKCIDEERESRPTMKEVVQVLRQIRHM